MMDRDPGLDNLSKRLWRVLLMLLFFILGVFSAMVTQKYGDSGVKENRGRAKIVRSW
ncbi:MAG: hypothetical protein KatS3mg087_0016 [Patescibacteria group bacterium]|nr:MAG: hypothetical protein KatS3mg087_0016 [Patescibacteria group bacterium]